MALTEIKTSGIADDAVTTDKLANAINTERTANTAKTSTTINNNADNRVITGSGTANTLEGESNLTFSGSALGVTGTTAITGNTSVGTTTQNWRFQAFGGRSTFTDTTAYALGIRKNSAQDADHNFWIGGAAANDDTHPDLVFSDNSGSEKFRFRQSGGLCFNGDTAAANALDDYEEGSFTPGVASYNGLMTMSYSNQVGKYTKIGRQVTVSAFVRGQAGGTQSNIIILTNLPFTVKETYNQCVVTDTGDWSSYESNHSGWGGYAQINNSYIVLVSVGDKNSEGVNCVRWGSTTYIYYTMTYFTDS